MWQGCRRRWRLLFTSCLRLWRVMCLFCLSQCQLRFEM
ncbi:unnamed protein product [Heterosigma akashiwo]